MHNALKKKLLEAGSVGLDMSPGDPLALEALEAIKSCETRIKELKLEIVNLKGQLGKTRERLDSFEEDVEFAHDHEIYHPDMHK
jgi:hypothetical protein